MLGEFMYLSMISGFRREVDENCALLGYYATNSGNFLPRYRDKLIIISPISGAKDPKESLFKEPTKELIEDGELRLSESERPFGHSCAYRFAGFSNRHLTL
jgi:hypothetical protein